MSDYLDDTDYTQIPMSSLTFDSEFDDHPDPATSSTFDIDVSKLASRVEQYQWIVSWLEKHKLYKTLDSLLEEGSEIASESFGLSKTVEVVERDDYAKSLLGTLNPHTGQNVLAARFHPNSELDLIASGSTDRTVVISNWKTGEKLTTIHGAHTGPILAIDWHPTMEGRLVLGSLDNSASVVDISGLRGAKESIRYEILFQTKIHRKHVVRAKWNHNGSRFATASYDHFLNIFEETASTSDAEPYHVIKSFELSEAVESVVWTEDGKWLIVSVRADNYLHYYDTTTWLETKFNMNVNQLDDHVSFTAMDLQLSKDGKHLLVSTDKNRVIMFATATPLQMRNFYDIPNGEWSTPRAAFNQSGTFIYISSEDKTIYVYDATTGTKVTILSGHTSNIRDLCPHPSLDTIATASFDKSVKIWQ